jgi:hypothetical protein
VIGSIVRWAALIACFFVTLSFLYFAVDQTSDASKQQVTAITGGAPDVKAESATKLPDPPPSVEKLREKENDKPHEFVDDVDDVLLAPFVGLSNSHDIWVRRLIPLALALLIYGIGGLYLARALGLKRW